MPSKEEQILIERYIQLQEERFDRLIEKEIKLVEIMNEYRTRLISDVVTGQVDLREVVIPDYDSEEIAIEEFEIETEVEEESEAEWDE